MIPFPDKKYQIIYADPPWNFNFAKRNLKTKEHLYPTMTPDEIINLPVESISNDNAVLFLWVMNSELPLALKCIAQWGFEYKTVAFTWVKKRKVKFHFGGGNWTRSNPELCLLAKKGTIKRKSASVRELLISELREHSRKPDIIRDNIIELVGDLPRIELFARNKTTGWDVWGNEVNQEQAEKE
ncbi:MAG: DNA methyltransferase [Bacteroidetes bacterium]|nr:DNA methyltransferase [Bacteroidota bacterium]